MKEMIEGIKHVMEELKRVRELTESHCVDGVLNIKPESVHLRTDKLIDLNNGIAGLQYSDRGSDLYPYEVYTYVEGIRFFCLADYSDAEDIFKEVIQEDRIAKLEAELAKLKGVEQVEQSV
jgi:hypothetical protein